MNGGADLGGMMGLGPIAIEKDEPLFHADGEKRAFGMTIGCLRTVEYRHVQVYSRKYASRRLYADPLLQDLDRCGCPDDETTFDDFRNRNRNRERD